MRLVLDVLSKRAGTALSLTDLASETGLTRAELTGAFSGFTRHLRTLWPDDEPEWPFRVTWGASVDGSQSGEAYYQLSKVHAEKWIKVRGQTAAAKNDA